MAISKLFSKTTYLEMVGTKPEAMAEYLDLLHKTAIKKIRAQAIDTLKIDHQEKIDRLEEQLKLSQKFNLSMDNVIIGGGSEGIMSVIMRTFLNKGDEIIATKNSFIGFRVLANASGFKVNWVPMKDFHYDLKSMAKKINDYTKVIYLANPDNPTGTYFNKKQFESQEVRFFQIECTFKKRLK